LKKFEKNRYFVKIRHPAVKLLAIKHERVAIRTQISTF